MNYKDALELQSMFTTAAQIAKSTNQQEYTYKIQEDVLVEYFKKAFPHLQNNNDIMKIIKKSYR